VCAAALGPQRALLGRCVALCVHPSPAAWPVSSPTPTALHPSTCGRVLRAPPAHTHTCHNRRRLCHEPCYWAAHSHLGGRLCTRQLRQRCHHGGACPRHTVRVDGSVRCASAADAGVALVDSCVTRAALRMLWEWGPRGGACPGHTSCMVSVVASLASAAGAAGVGARKLSCALLITHSHAHTVRLLPPSPPPPLTQQ
jgi:hypothetical protein